ncbi:MAG: hypothetical protein K8F90_09880 [Hyphomicrobiales bacterium]|nr:hypothetical protein [Hyphomicrobiales bacterium]
MDWEHAIKRNSEVLAGIVESLFVMLGLVGEATVSRLPWPTYRAVLRVLRPAESCLRRLIVVAARGLVVEPPASRPRPAGAKRARKGGYKRSLSFQLFDPQARIVFPRRKRPPRVLPRIHFFNTDGEFITIGPPIRPAKASTPARAKSADGMVNAARVIRRLEALEAALADLPRQAKRLVRWRMREEKSENPSFKTPLRPGRPPGYRRRDVHQVDELLSECQWLAWEAMKPDTS